MIKNSRGRNYLMWINPLLNRNHKLLGAVIVKVDIWDCIHEFSQDTDLHFLIKLNKVYLLKSKTWTERL